MAPLKIVIVGSGIAGPAAAIGLARNGHQVTIYERSTVGQEVGYAFRITANSDRCLKHLGIDTVAGGAVPANANRLYSHTGNFIGEVKENRDAEKAKQATSVFAYRPQLVKQLMDAALETGRVEVKSGMKVKGVNVEETRIVLANGETVDADLVIAADGLHSVIRPFVIDGNQYFPKPTGDINVIRFTVPKALAQEDPLLSSAVTDDAAMLVWNGGDTMMIVYQVDYGRLLNVTLSHPARRSNKETQEGDSAALTSYNRKASLETVLDIHKGWDPRAIRLIELADQEGFRIWKLMDMDDIPTCSRGNTVLIGDACHPVLPFSYSGASMAIEDAITLSTFLEEDVKAEDVPGLLKLYEEARNHRVRHVRDEGRRRVQLDRTKEEMQQFRDFLQDHDAVKYAQEKLAGYKEKRA